MCRMVAISLTLWLMNPLMASADSSTEIRITRETFWRAWNGDLLILLNLSFLGIFYGRGLTRLRRRAGRRRGIHSGQGAAFLGSLVVLLVALISPLHALSEQLSSAHMVQHLLLMGVAAPLFVLSAPGPALLWGLEPDWRPSVVAGLRRLNVAPFEQPLSSWMLHTAVLWFWHWPVAYEAALVDSLVHDAQHLSFFIVSCLYWRVLLDPPRRRRPHPLIVVGSLFATSLQAMLLGVFLALSPTVWYEAFASTTQAWGLSPLEDQQLAGFIMWMPACLVYPAAAAVALGHWLTATTSISAGRQRYQGV